MKKVYIAGKITGCENYKENFSRLEKRLLKMGCKVMNPTVLPEGFEHKEYLKVCFAMIDVCDTLCFLDNWGDSPGAIQEFNYAFKKKGKHFMQESDLQNTEGDE